MKYIVSKSDQADGNPIGADEPCFVIRATDVFAIRAIEAYIELTDELVSRDMTNELTRHLQRIKLWQAKNRNKVKVPD